ncbi:MAG: DsrE family protein [Candidatus Xenobia bacterium]
MSTSVPPTFAEKDLNYYLRQIRGDFAELEETQAVKVGGPSSQKNIVILLSSNHLGSNQELGRKLMRHFIAAICTNRVKPRAIILTNEAIHLALETSEVVGKLTALEEQGTRIMVCVTSADEYGVADKLKVGCIADMDAIADHLLQAWKVISL